MLTIDSMQHTAKLDAVRRHLCLESPTYISSDNWESNPAGLFLSHSSCSTIYKTITCTTGCLSSFFFKCVGSTFTQTEHADMRSCPTTMHDLWTNRCLLTFNIPPDRFTVHFRRALYPQRPSDLNGMQQEMIPKDYAQVKMVDPLTFLRWSYYSKFILTLRVRVKSNHVI